jgi:hypothetical protein
MQKRVYLIYMKIKTTKQEQNKITKQNNKTRYSNKTTTIIGVNIIYAFPHRS